MASPSFFDRVEIMGRVRAVERGGMTALERHQRETLRQIRNNAESWHDDNAAKERALRVIAAWAEEALAGRLHPTVAALSRDEFVSLAEVLEP